MTHSNSQKLSRHPCECCGSNNFTLTCDRQEGSMVVRCLGCDLEFVNPPPDEKALEEIYLRDMKSKTNGIPFFREYIEERKNRRRSYEKVYKSRLDLIESFCPQKGNLLDIGCGAGFFLEYAKSRGWRCHGIDILPEYIRFAKEELHLENMKCSSLADTQFKPGAFDVVTLWDLIEHLTNPLSILKRINQILRTNGVLVIWTPNVKNAAVLKDRWTGYWPRQHLFFFSLRTLRKLLLRSGFQIQFYKTTKTKKGLLISQNSLTFEKIKKPEDPWGRRWFGAKRNLKNFIHPMTYMSPLLDQAGYGFNLLVVAKKSAHSTSGDNRDLMKKP